MKAIILAAGRGTRMGGMTDQVPKGLVDLCGISLFERALASLRAADVREIAVVTGYKRESFERFGLTEFHNPNWATTNMVASLGHAHDWLATSPTIVCYSDIFFSPEWIRSLAASQGGIAITYDKAWEALWSDRFGDVLLDAETFKLDGEHVAEIGFKPKSKADIQGQYMGLLKFTPDGWRTWNRGLDRLSAEGRARISVTEVLERLVEDGAAIAAVPGAGQWGEVDQPTDLALYERYVREGQFGAWFATSKPKNQ